MNETTKTKKVEYNSQDMFPKFFAFMNENSPYWKTMSPAFWVGAVHVALTTARVAFEAWPSIFWNSNTSIFYTRSNKWRLIHYNIWSLIDIFPG